MEDIQYAGERRCPSARAPVHPGDSDPKVRMAEDGWNTRDAERVALAYTTDSTWRNRTEFISGRDAIVEFLRRKWARELDYRLIKELWSFDGDRIAVRFAYEWHDDSGSWFRSYGNENWEFDEHGLMRRRIASINDVLIAEGDRKYHWPLGRRLDDHPGLSDLDLQAPARKHDYHDGGTDRPQRSIEVTSERALRVTGPKLPLG